MELKNIKTSAKKSLAIFMVVLMLMSTFGTSLAFAKDIFVPKFADDFDAEFVTGGDCSYYDEDDDEYYGEVTWELYDDGTLIISGDGQMKNYSNWTECKSDIAPWLDYEINEWYDEWEDIQYKEYHIVNSDTVKNVIIDDGVTNVGRYAFYDCSSLESVTFPETLEYIGSYAFAYCSSLTAVDFPESLSDINYDAFYRCYGLTSVEIPANVSYISYEAFGYCSSIESFTVAEDNERYYSDENGCLYYHYFEDYDDDEYDEEYVALYYYPAASLTEEFTVPADVDCVEYYAFREAYNLKKLTVPNAYTEICDLWDTGLQEVVAWPYSSAHERAYDYSYDEEFDEGVIFTPINGVTVESMEITALPYRLEYEVDSWIDLGGFEVTVKYSDGSSFVKEDDWGYNSDLSEAGTSTVTVYYIDKEFTYDITVYDKRYLTVDEACDFNLAEYSNYFYFTAEASGDYYIDIPGITEGCADLYKYEYYYDEEWDEEWYDTEWVDGWYYENDADLEPFVFTLEEGETYQLYIHSHDLAQGELTPTSITLKIKCLHENIEEAPQQDPTCEENGYTAGLHCADCDKWFDGHEYMRARHADADLDGICDICGEDSNYVVLGQPATVDEHDEKFVFIPEYSGNFTLVPANTEYFEMEIYAERLGIDYDDEDYDDEDWIYLPDSYYFEEGVTYFLTAWVDDYPTTFTIVDCDHENVAETEETAPTCTEPGYSASVQCQDCGLWLEEVEEYRARHTDVEPDGICDVCGEASNYIILGQENTLNSNDDTFVFVPEYSADYVIDFDDETYMELYWDSEYIGTDEVVDEDYDTYDGGGDWWYGEPRESRYYYFEEGYIYFLSGWAPEYPVTFTIHDCEHDDTVDMPAVAPTCSTAGYTEGVQCTTCGMWVEGHDYIDYLPHRYELVETQAPTCDGWGWADVVCTVCGYEDGYEMPERHADADLNGTCDVCGGNSYYLPSTGEYTVTSDNVYYGFVPAYTGEYTITSFGENIDPVCSVYDEFGQWLNGADDDLEDMNFELTYNFEAGVFYYLRLRSYGFDEEENEYYEYPITITFNGEVDEPTTQPTTKPAVTQPTTQPTTKPAATQPATQPTTKPAVTQPATQPTTKPAVTQPTTAPIVNVQPEKPEAKAIKTNSVKISWDAVSGAESYIVEYSTDNGKTWKKETTTKTNLKINGLKAGTKVLFKVTAVAGGKESQESKVFTTATKPARVTLSSVKSLKAKQILVTWKKVSGANGYEVAYSTTKKFKKKETKTVTVKKGKTSKKTIKNLKSDKKYFVKVRAYKTVNGKKLFGTYSKVKNVTVV